MNIIKIRKGIAFSIIFITDDILFFDVILRCVKLMVRTFIKILAVPVKISISVSVPTEIQSLNLLITNTIRR